MKIAQPNCLRREFKRSRLLQLGQDRHLSALFARITQTAACNRFHLVEGRLARWLLMTSDRVRSDKFQLTLVQGMNEA